MELFVFLVCCIILIVMLSGFRKETQKTSQLLQREIQLIHKKIEALGEVKSAQPNTKGQPAVTPTAPKPLKTTGQRLVTLPPKAAKPKPSSPSEEAKKPVQKQTKPTVQTSKPKAALTTAKPPLYATQSASSKSTPAKTRDYEKLIGENWLNKVGIAILVIGVGFFVKYAIDQNWIGTIGRVIIGFATGASLTVVAHFLRKKYHGFSSVLIGGGISIQYYTVSIAYHDYGVFSQKAAFVILCLITLITILFSLFYNRKELAIIALIGGFTSPFMVQGETQNYLAFFTYISLLNAGMFALSYFKKWSILLKLALGFTLLFFGTWLLITPLGLIKSNWALFFASLFFIEFLGATLIHNLAKRTLFNAFEFIQLSSITVLYYAAGLYLIPQSSIEISHAGFSLIMAGLFAGIFILARWRAHADRALIYLLAGKTILFITLAGGLAFDGDYMTLFWTLEGVLLLALGQYGKLPELKKASLLVTIITVFALIKDWFLYYSFEATLRPPVFNEAFFTSAFTLIGLTTTFILVRREKEDSLSFWIRPIEYAWGLGITIFIGIYISSLLEMQLQVQRLNYEPGELLWLWIFHFIMLFGGLAYATQRSSTILKSVFFFLGIAGALLYLSFAQQTMIQIRTDALSSMGNIYFYLHYLLVALVIGTLLIQRALSKSVFESTSQRNTFLCVLSVLGLIIASAELDQLLVFTYANDYSTTTVLRHSQTEGYTILWGLYSFIIMIRGMQKQNRLMRVLALVLFTITLLKLFIFDIQNISEAGKIVAFISLGILLLIVSFMYQKLKQLIIGGQPESTPEIN